MEACCADCDGVESGVVLVVLVVIVVMVVCGCDGCGSGGDGLEQTGLWQGQLWGVVVPLHVTVDL